MFILPFIQAVIIRLFLQRLIWRYVTHHHIQDKSGILKKQKLIWSEIHLMTSTGKVLFQTQMLTRKCVSSINLFSMFWVTLFHTKSYYVMIRIPHSLTLGLSLFRRPEIKFSKIIGKNKTNIQLPNKLNFIQEYLKGLIIKLKNNYYKSMANKLNNLQRNLKPYWSLLKCFFKQQQNTSNSTTASQK